MKCSGVLLAGFVLLLVEYSVQNDIRKEDVVYAEVQSCKGCQLRGLPEVKDFIFEDVPLYDNVVFKAVQGAPPQLILYDKHKQELTRIALRDYTRRGCRELMEEYGFKKSGKPEL